MLKTRTKQPALSDKGLIFMILREKIEFLMNEKKVNIATLSRETQIPFTTIASMLKRNQSNIKISRINILKDFFDVSMDYLLDENIVDRHYVKGEKKLSANERYLLMAYNNRTEMKTVINLLLDLKEDIEEKPDKYRYIELYNLPVSAGCGVYLEDNGNTMIKIPLNYTSSSANFALRVSGDSMEPDFSDGDIILIKTQPSVEISQLGIFILNNKAYFKKFGNGCLYSINKQYSPIYFSENDNITCKGRIIGKL